MNEWMNKWMNEWMNEWMILKKETFWVSFNTLNVSSEATARGLLWKENL